MNEAPSGAGGSAWSCRCTAQPRNPPWLYPQPRIQQRGRCRSAQPRCCMGRPQGEVLEECFPSEGCRSSDQPDRALAWRNFGAHSGCAVNGRLAANNIAVRGTTVGGKVSGRLLSEDAGVDAAARQTVVYCL